MIRVRKATKPSRKRDTGRYMLVIGQLVFHLSAKEVEYLSRFRVKQSKRIR